MPGISQLHQLRPSRSSSRIHQNAGPMDLVGFQVWDDGVFFHDFFERLCSCTVVFSFFLSNPHLYNSVHLVWTCQCARIIFKGCRPCRRPRKNRQGSQANWHKNSSVLRTLRLSTFFLCILLWNIFDRFEFSFVNGFFMIYWLSWSRRSLCMSIQVLAMWSGGVAVWVAVFDLGWTYNKWHYHKGIFTLWSWTKLHCVARGCLARNCWFVLMVFSFHFFLGWCVWPPLRES